MDQKQPGAIFPLWIFSAKNASKIPQLIFRKHQNTDNTDATDEHG